MTKSLVASANGVVVDPRSLVELDFIDLTSPPDLIHKDVNPLVFSVEARNIFELMNSAWF